MELKNANAVTFDDDNKIYVYDRFSNSFLEITKTIEMILDDSILHSLDYIQKKYSEIDSRELEDSYYEIKELINLDLLRRTDIKRLSLSSSQNNSEIVKNKLNSKLAHLILCITEECNLRCKYCIYSGNYKNVTREHSGKKMSLETAKLALDYFMSHSNISFKERTIGFYGGEPMIHFNFIKEIVEYVRKRYGRVKYLLNTNLILISDEIINYFIDNDFEINLSLDGPQQIHDKFRVTKMDKDTHKIVEQNLRRIRNISEDYFNHNLIFNVMVNPVRFLADSLDEYFNTSIFNGLESKAFRVLVLNSEDNNYADKCNYWSYYNEFYADSLFKFIERHKNSEVKDFSDMKISYAFHKREFAKLHFRDMNKFDEYDYYWPNGICIPGTRSVFVSTDGKYYPCEKLYDHYSTEIGNTFHGINENKVIQMIDEYAEKSVKICSSCWAFRLCGACFFACRDKEESYSFTKKHEFCINTKNSLLTIFKIYLKILKMNPSAFDYLTEEDKEIPMRNIRGN